MSHIIIYNLQQWQYFLKVSCKVQLQDKYSSMHGVRLNVKEFQPTETVHRFSISDYIFSSEEGKLQNQSFCGRQFWIYLIIMVFLEYLKKQCALVDYVGENFFVNLLPLKCNDTGRRKLDVCMDLKLIKYGIPGSRGPAAQPPDAEALLT